MDKILFVIGVSGSGKTTIAKLIAQSYDIPFFDADDYHPESNKAKMASGVALEDADRWPWLERLNTLATSQTRSCVIACSALKQAYRLKLASKIEHKVIWIQLVGSMELIASRLKKRSDHFMPASLLQSQFDTFEKETSAITIDVDQSIENILLEIQKRLNGMKSEFGILGLAVMGSNLARNIGRNGISLSMYNRYVENQEELVAQNLKDSYPELQDAQAFEDLSLFVDSLERPRKVLIMVKASALDFVLDELTTLLSPEDIVIDGGNSHYKLTEERAQRLEALGIVFVGMGISGGSEGALLGPAMMPGGRESSYQFLKPTLEKIAAKNKLGESCVAWIGNGGAGHFVKMIHNGVEYAEMQLLAECYHIMRDCLAMDYPAIAATFGDWNSGEDGSYLLEITAQIFNAKKDGVYILDTILDSASNKGTGAWASIAGIELGVPFNIISSALFARYISSFKTKREKYSKQFMRHDKHSSSHITLQDLQIGYRIARMLNHAQGFDYLQEASDRHDWNLNLSGIAKVWTAGCIIRSELMFDIKNNIGEKTHLLELSHWNEKIRLGYPALKDIVKTCIDHEIPIPTFSACIQFFNALKQENSSANLIQAQRDFFGSHGFQILNREDTSLHHANWTEL